MDSRWDEVIDRFRQQLIVSDGLAKNSVESYCSDLTHFRNFMSSRELKPSAADVYVLTDYLESCRQGEYSRRTINRRISTLNRFYSFLKQQDEVDMNPVESLDRPGKNSFFPDYLDEEEVEELLGAPDVESDPGLRDRALLETLYGAGLRASEAAGLRTDGIDWERGELRIIGKGDKQRLVPLGREALDWLEKYVREARDDWVTAGNGEYFFLEPDGKPITRQKIWSIVKKYAAQQGLPDVTPHTLRHSFATHMLAGGADLRGLQKMLGHSDVRTTADIYVHLQDEVREAHENFHPRGG